MKNVLFFIFFLIPVLCFGQDRVHVESPVISDVISVLNYAKGWKYNKSSEQWTGRDNELLGSDSFTKLEFRKVTYKNHEYLLLIKYFMKPHWDYPTIKKGYNPYESMFFFLFDKDEFVSQLSTNSDSTFNIKCRMILNNISGMGVGINTHKSLSSIRSVMASHINNPNDNNFHNVIIQFRNYKDKGISRFLIFHEECRINEYSENKELTCENSGFAGIGSSIYKSSDRFYFYNDLGTNEIYNSIYYECDYESFNNFIQLRK